MGKLDGKAVMITGAGRGIGAGIARRAASEGARVAVTDVDAGAAEAMAAQIADAGGTAIGLGCDVTDRDGVAKVIKAVVSEYGRLDVAFNNAGISKAVRFLDTTEDDFQKIMAVNAGGVFICMQEEAAQMRTQGGGKIVNTASIAGKTGFPLFAAYSASKFAVVALTQAGAQALGADGITVNSFCPGVVATELWQQLDGEFIEMGESEKPGQALEEFGAAITLGRLSKPDDIEGLAVFLASSDSDYITGQSINVDGGMVFD